MQSKKNNSGVAYRIVMIERKIKNVSASIKDKLYNIAQKEKIEFNSLLLKYFQERFLHRLSISQYKDNFILKGGLLLVTIDIPKSRPTIDVDFLARRIKNDHDEIKKTFLEICKIQVNDGIDFDSKTIEVGNIMQDTEYVGLRVNVTAYLGQAKNKLQIGISFGDIITPKPRIKEFPSILGSDKTILKVYPLETVVAEKYQTMIKKEIVNSRMKDFYDVYVILKENKIDINILKKAVSETFKNRQTAIPENPYIFYSEFYNDDIKQTQWKAFLRKNKLSGIPENFKDIVFAIKKFLIKIV